MTRPLTKIQYKTLVESVRHYEARGVHGVWYEHTVSLKAALAELDAHRAERKTRRVREKETEEIYEALRDLGAAARLYTEARMGTDNAAWRLQKLRDAADVYSWAVDRKEGKGQ